jgi:glutathione-regulated potassium-efflux system protein KefB
MLADRDLLASGAGRDSFAVLLFQDLASIPMIALVPLLAAHAGETGQTPWLHILAAVGAVAAIVFGGRYVIRPLFRVVGGVRTTEVFTATALLVVAGAAALAQFAGLPMSLGAFAAGVVMSESAYRHELQADIEPFEGLLLGFFFISVGMSANIGLAIAEPVTILVGVVVLLALKIAIGFGLQKLRGAPTPLAARFALTLPQGSEFAFVLFGAALAAGALTRPDADRAMLVVALSMFASPILFSLSERHLIPRLCAVAARPFDTVDDAKPAPVVICGFGRVGQIVGRVLAMRQINFNALDPDSDNVDTLRRFGYRTYYGDPTRIDLLRAVGVGEAKLLVVALPDVEQNLRVVETAKRHFPDLQIYARARNRRHFHLLMELGAGTIVRETFFSSLRLSELVLGGLGVPPDEAKRSVQRFREHDEQTLVDQHGFHDDEKQMIQNSAQAAAELRRLWEADLNR